MSRNGRPELFVEPGKVGMALQFEKKVQVLGIIEFPPHWIFMCALLTFFGPLAQTAQQLPGLPGQLIKVQLIKGFFIESQHIGTTSLGAPENEVMPGQLMFNVAPIDAVEAGGVIAKSYHRIVTLIKYGLVGVSQSLTKSGSLLAVFIHMKNRET